MGLFADRQRPRALYGASVGQAGLFGGEQHFTGVLKDRWHPPFLSSTTTNVVVGAPGLPGGSPPGLRSTSVLLCAAPELPP